MPYFEFHALPADRKSLAAAAGRVLESGPDSDQGEADEEVETCPRAEPLPHR